jgi:amino acid adenylation domain-containing protein
MQIAEGTSAELSDAKRALLTRRLRGLASNDEETASIHPRPDGVPIRISVDQYRIWLHHSLRTELPLYNEPISLFHAGKLDPALLQNALEFYAQRHEAWRTGFHVVGDDVLQQIVPAVTVPVALYDLSEWQIEAREAEDERIAQENAILAFDLTQPPLFRAALVRMSAEQDRLHMVVHHSVFDGTAIRDSFLPEFVAIYDALAQGQAPALPPLALQYPDFSLWREQQLNSESMAQSVQFWKKKLEADLPVLRLPLDRPRPQISSQRGAMYRFTLSAGLTSQLRLIGRQHRATLYMVLLASLDVLLFRYTGQNDIIVGTAANGRGRPELQGMMGYILNTFPVRVQPAADQKFLEFLGLVRTEFFSAAGAAEVPFDQIVKVSGTRQDPSYHPIFQTFFSFLSPASTPTPGWELQPKMVNTGTAKFDLYIEAEERADDVAACILYSTDLFDAVTMERLAGHWTTMLEAIAQNPATTLGVLPILTEAERRLMLVDWNHTEAPVPASTIHDLFEEQARRTPTKIAVQFGKIQLSYAELDEQAERLAHLLQQAGSGPGKLVAVCIDRSENLLAALLGILKTGAAYLPLDPGTPLSRISLCLEDAEPAVLLTQKALVERLPKTSATILCLEDVLPAAAALDAGLRITPGLSGPDDSAYIIHTSGSTGRPKAVELTHRAVVNLLLSFQREPGLTADDVLVAITTISFDIAALELFLPIVTGARVVIAPRTTALDPFELSDLLEATKCTVVQATPATWRALMAIDWPGKPGLRVLCGGEALTQDLGQKLMDCNVELWNVYGPTETCIWSTIYRVKGGETTMPIGRPIANTTTYILDANQQPVPVGVAGELYIGGMGLAKGYRAQPELTAEKFLAPAIANGKQLYRTGDYALYRADGTIECRGRTDNQVKVRGYRIELEEVELHLSAYQDVASAAARVWKDEAAGNRLTGYVVARPGLTIDPRELRRFLQPRLPEYMIPTQFILLDEMPLTPNGKTDRKALPESIEHVVVPVQVDEAMTDDEERLAKIWCDVLNVPHVSRHDNFFALGGHSLLLVVLFARINRRFSTNLPLTTIFDAQTLMALAKLLHQKARISSLVPVQTQGNKPPLFMAHSYLLYHGLSRVLDADQPFYGLRELETDGELSIEARALLYVADMRSVQPEGPYHVAGWCAAGPLAVEIARQLILQEETVGTLLLFDAWLPEYLAEVQRAQARQSWLEFLKSKWTHYEDQTTNLSLSAKCRHVWQVARRVAKQRRDDFYMNHWSAMHRISQKLHIPLPEFMHNTTLQTLFAMRQFQAGSLPVKITLLRASESLHIPSATDSCGWERVAEQGVSVKWVPGNHERMFRDSSLKLTGRLVQSALNETTETPAH